MAAYRVSEEAFMSDYKKNVGDLKLRLTYGILGVQSVDDYSYLTTYTKQANRYGFNNSSLPGIDYSIGNEMITWESSANFNIGFDATFLRNSLDVSFDWFNKRTYDILLVPVVPRVFGTSNAGTQNLGEMRNRGWEVSLAYRIKTGAFAHRASFNIADSKNEMTDFGGRVEPFHHDYWVSTMYEHQTDFWTPDNPGAKNPRLATTGTSRQNNWQRIGTDRYMFNMAYVRIKDIRLTYTVPKQLISKASIARARISLNVQNPFTFSKQAWVDPESTNFGNTMGGRSGAGAFLLRGNYPLLRYYGASIDLEF